MNMPIPLDASLANSPGRTCPRQAAEVVMKRCRQARGFQAERDFWMEFGRIYAQVRATVAEDQQFAFATQVDGRLAEMGLAPWSIMSRLAMQDDQQPPQPANR